MFGYSYDHTAHLIKLYISTVFRNTGVGLHLRVLPLCSTMEYAFLVSQMATNGLKGLNIIVANLTAFACGAQIHFSWNRNAKM